MKKITSIEIHNSEFFKEGFKINFSENLNCIMGGRGTGKSTLLHFIKCCLELNAEEDKTTFSVLKGNLGSGLIKLFIQTENGNEYQIEKSFGEEPQPELSPKNEHIPLDTIKKELICDIYPAQIIEEIGRNSMARLELIDRMIVDDSDELTGNIETVQTELEKNAKDIRSLNQRIAKLKETLKEYANVETEFAKHKGAPPKGTKKVVTSEFTKEDKSEKVRGAESRFLKGLQNTLSLNLEKIKELNDALTSTQSLIENTEKFDNEKVIQPLKAKVIEILNSISKSNNENLKLLAGALIDVNAGMGSLKSLHDQQHNKFIKLKQKLDKHKIFYDKLNALSKKVDEKKIRLKENGELITKIEKLKSKRESLIRELNEYKKQIYNLRLSKINELNKLFAGKIKITLTPGGIRDDYENALKNALKGHNMRYNTIVPYIIENFTPDKFAKIIHDKDLRKLKEISSIDNDRSQTVLDALHESDAIYQIESIYCQDLPDFYLKIDQKENGKGQKEYYKKSDELSTGQRCTTVLPIIFSISKNPLVIDQPEDNLDNKYISDTIHEIIKEQKKVRQLIFITHNANIPVLSNAEQNTFLMYDNKKSEISDEGDVEHVKDRILQLLEGGEEAFKKRKTLYGF